MEIDFYSLLQDHMEMTLFMIIGIGYLLGKLGIGNVKIGSSIGVLFVALAFGHLGFTMSSIVGTIGFVFFIYSVGYQAGPHFFQAFKQDGVRYIQIGLIIAFAAFATTLLGRSLFQLEPGYAAGVLAGALTSTPTLAAAQDALSSGLATIPIGQSASAVEANLTVAYAVTYIFGLVGLILFLQIAPKIFGFDLHNESIAYAKDMATESIDDDDEMGLGHRGFPNGRSYEVSNPKIFGKSLLELKFLQTTGAVIARLEQESKEATIGPETVLNEGDRIMVLGYSENHLSVASLIGNEIDYKEFEQTPFETHRIVVTNEEAIDMTLRDTGVTNQFACITHSVIRGGVNLPISLEMIIKRGDHLTISGFSSNLNKLVNHLGHHEKPIHETDLVTFSMGILVGLFIGYVTVKLGGIPLGIGSAGGLLVAGLVVGWLRMRNPLFGRVPAAARFILMELGLLFFLTGVGLRAGSGLVEGIRSAGVPLFCTGVIVTLVPVIIGVLYGRFVLKMNPAILLGAICGGLTSTPALDVINKQAKSDIPAMGYVGVYAFSNIILAIAGQLIMIFFI
jgi:putative transport protein